MKLGGYMPETFYDTIVVLFFTVVPLVFLFLHTFLSTRKRLVWSLIVPTLWTALGMWMMVAGYVQDRNFSWELLIFFLVGDLLLIGIAAIVSSRKKRKK
jgi:hypothetical protein